MVKPYNERMLFSLAWWLLRLTYGTYWGIIGLDKFFGYVTESHNRVSTHTLVFFPFGLTTLLRLVGLLEITVALLILTKWPKIGTTLGIILMALIVMNLIAMKTHYDIAIHGTAIGLGMVGFLLLSFLRSYDRTKKARE